MKSNPNNNIHNFHERFKNLSNIQFSDKENRLEKASNFFQIYSLILLYNHNNLVKFQVTKIISDSVSLNKLEKRIIFAKNFTRNKFRIAACFYFFKFAKAVLLRKKTAKDKALRHFDDFYKTVFGPKLWRSMRLGLLCPNKYCAVINNFGEPEKTMGMLEIRGALNMRNLFEINKKNAEEDDEEKHELKTGDAEDDQEIEENETKDAIYKLQTKLGDFISEKEDIDPVLQLKTEYPGKSKRSEKSCNVDTKYQEKLSLFESLSEAEIDQSRLIYPDEYSNSPMLHEFLPVTKLKGMDEYVAESSYYNYYKNSQDFPITVEDELQPLRFPGCLNVYTYEKCNITPFPAPSKIMTGMLDYYLLDGSSVLPVIALDLMPGDCMLDICAAPGGKSITALQSLCLDKIRCNERSPSRFNQLNNVINEYFYKTDRFDLSINVTNENAFAITEEDDYNKILVDVPCTTDRLSLVSDEENMFHNTRIKERLQLPQYQADLLSHALKLIPVGGTVVYSTCSLSPVQNDGVIQLALQQLWAKTNRQFIVKNLMKIFEVTDNVFHIGKHVGFKYGVLVVPHLTANFGPSYFSKIVRTR